MITVTVEQKINDNYEFQKYDCQAEFSAPEDSTADGIVEMFAAAMELEGFTKSCVLQAFYEYAEDAAYNYKIKLGDEDVEDSE